MSRPLGLPKTGGRIKGTPNKRTEAFAFKLNELNINLLEEISKCLPNLEPEKRVHTLVAMLPYCYSKASAEVELNEASEEFFEMSDEELESKTVQLLEKYRKEYI